MASKRLKVAADCICLSGHYFFHDRCYNLGSFAIATRLVAAHFLVALGGSIVSDRGGAYCVGWIGIEKLNEVG